ncbi:MAG TPA: DinB family protein [Acidimicrobiales bacterium]|nr:DinB family protein [Acidimicrobiales bacterium]
MSAEAPTTAGMTAAEVVATNAALDAKLLAELEAADLGVPAPGEAEWSPIEVAAHLAEFPRFFAAELERWMSDRETTVGRTHDDAGRLAAVGAAPGTDPEEARAAVAPAFALLARVLERLEDADVAAETNNVKYGREPLSAFLDRYVVGHKAGHLEQLRALARRSGAGERPEGADR